MSFGDYVDACILEAKSTEVGKNPEHFFDTLIHKYK